MQEFNCCCIIYAGYCYINECCEPAWVSYDIAGINDSLRKNVFGQHLVRDIVPTVIKAHREDKNPEKPLVLAFHGNTGSGKNFVSGIIADRLYYKGIKSKYVHKFLSSHLFPDQNLVPVYREDIKRQLKEVIKKCEKALFIIDEIDKMPFGLADTFKPYLDYNDNVDGYDFRKSIFIFMGNTGVQEINDVAIAYFLRGKDREIIKMKSMNKLLRAIAYQTGGMKNAALIDSHLINFHVPFLPLERNHIRMCAEVELVKAGKRVSSVKLDAIVDELEYFPEEYNVYSLSGCKNIKSLVQILGGN